MQLVSVSEDLKSFHVDSEALDIIQRIEGDIGIVSVCGAQRTGKSYILNVILDKFGSKGLSNLSLNAYSFTSSR